MTAFFADGPIGLKVPGRGPAALLLSLVLPLAVLALLWKAAGASEFPERECCDDLVPPAVDAGLDVRKTVPLAGNGGGGGGTTSSFSTEMPPHSSEHPDTSNFLYPEFIPELSLDLGYPLPPPPLHPHHQHPHPPDGTNYVPTTTGTGLHQGQPASAILNCLLAHQLCAEDPSCKSIETVIQHICGPETVACSTTTVTKCQAGLRTLQAFPVFHPTCLCREPSVDPDCNAFRDSLFDHPCMVATQKERDLYPIHALPTCTHALDVCQKDLSCTRLYNDFREHCKLRSGVCRDKETCYNAWRGLRMTPLFGCFCPGNDQKKCERIYSFIYNNTCVASWQESLSRQRETDGRQIESRLMDSIHHHHHHGAAAETGSIDVARFSHFLQSALTRTRIGYHSSSSSVSSIHAASAAAAAAAASGVNNGSASYYSTSSSSSYNTSATSSNHSRF